MQKNAGSPPLDRQGAVAPHSGCGERHLHRIEDRSFTEGFEQIGDGPKLQDFRSHGVIRMRCDEHDRYAHLPVEGRTLEQALLRAYDASLSLYFSGNDDARGCFVVGTAITEAVDDPEVREIINAGTAMLDATFEARLQVAREAGELESNADVETLAKLATAIMHTLAVRARGGTPRDELRRLARGMAQVICG